MTHRPFLLFRLSLNSLLYCSLGLKIEFLSVPVRVVAMACDSELVPGCWRRRHDDTADQLK